MNNDQVFVFAMTMLICATAVVLTVAMAFIRRRKVPPPSREMASDRGFNDRLDRMERAIDTIAVEIERVSEAQRFVTKVLAERKSVAPPPAIPERVITPH
jgi:hypothetical protein